MHTAKMTSKKNKIKIKIKTIGISFFFFFNCIYFYRREGREEGRKTSVCGCLACILYWGPDQDCNTGMYPDWGNLTGDLLVCRMALNPLSHTNQGKKLVFTEK